MAAERGRIGGRQGLQAQKWSGTTKVALSFTTDRGPFLIKRIKLYDPTDGIFGSGATLRIQAEGELLYSGQFIPVYAVAVRTDGGATAGTALESPHIITFDQPLELSKDYPITIDLGSFADDVWVILEGV